MMRDSSSVRLPGLRRWLRVRVVAVSGRGLFAGLLFFLGALCHGFVVSCSFFGKALRGAAFDPGLGVGYCFEPLGPSG